MPKNDRTRKEIIEDVIDQRMIADCLPVPDEPKMAMYYAVWSRILEPIPTAMIEQLFYDCCIAEAGGEAAPGPRDILAFYQAKLVPEYHQPAVPSEVPALPAGERKVPAYVTAFIRHGGPVDCHCTQHYNTRGVEVVAMRGKPTAATLKTAEDLWNMARTYQVAVIPGLRYWVCRSGACDFIFNADDLPARTGAAEPREAGMMDFESVFAEAGDAVEVEIAA